MTNNIRDLLDQMYDVPDAHKNNAYLPAGNCPVCSSKGQWRRGIGFEHEKICMAHEPHVVWCPSDIEDYRNALAELQKGQGGDGI